MVQVQINLELKNKNLAKIEVNLLRREDANEQEAVVAKAFEALIKSALEELAKDGIIKILRVKMI